MGAIFGILGQHERDTVPRMGRLLAHRGPAVIIREVSDDLTIGAIGRDPDRMIHATGERVVVADATFYNDHEAGGSSDDAGGLPGPLAPASLLHEMDPAADPQRLAAIDGDYAFALVDRHAKALLFGRDFFGTRPLYVCRLKNGGTAFASEYKALLAVRGEASTVDRDMVQYVHNTKRLPVGRTLFREIVEAPPGTLSRYSAANGFQPLYAIPAIDVKVTVRDEPDAIDLIQGHLRRSLRARIECLQTIGLALSGGIDSIALAFLLREARPDGEIHTFTAGSDHDDPELITASRVAKAIGSVHHEVLTPPELLNDRLPRLVWHLEDPLSRSEALQLFELGRNAANVVDVLLTAQGADGLFAGMPKYRLLWLAERLPMFKRGFEDFYNRTQYGIETTTTLGLIMDYLKYRGRLARVPTVQGAVPPIPGSFPEAGPEFINRAAARGLQTGVCQDLHKFDRGFSAFGIEARFPFYDMRLVRMAFTITDRLKINAKTQKYIFRKAMQNIVPDDFRKLSKFPMRMRYDRKFAAILDETGSRLLLRRGGLLERDLFDETSVRRLFRSSAQKAYLDEGAMRIWTAIMTEIWMRTFVDGPPSGPLPPDESSAEPAPTEAYPEPLASTD